MHSRRIYTLGQLDEMHSSSFKIEFNCAFFWFGHHDFSHSKKITYEGDSM